MDFFDLRNSSWKIGMQAVESYRENPFLLWDVPPSRPFAGVYDLNMLFDKSDIARYDKWLKYLEGIAGSDEEKLEQISLVNHIEKLKTPVLVIHGKKDQRANIKHAELMIKHLKKHKKSHQTLIKSNEAHGFYNEDNREEMYRKIVEFLGEHI